MRSISQQVKFIRPLLSLRLSKHHINKEERTVRNVPSFSYPFDPPVNLVWPPETIFFDAILQRVLEGVRVFLSGLAFLFARSFSPSGSYRQSGSGRERWSVGCLENQQGRVLDKQ